MKATVYVHKDKVEISADRTRAGAVVDALLADVALRIPGASLDTSAAQRHASRATVTIQSSIAALAQNLRNVMGELLALGFQPETVACG